VVINNGGTGGMRCQSCAAPRGGAPGAVAYRAVAARARWARTRTRLPHV